jgi:hypothetical protein
MNQIDQLMQKDYTYSQYAYNTSGTTVTDNVAALTAERDELLNILAIINGEMDDYIANKLDDNNLIYWNTTNGTIKGYRFTIELDNTDPAKDDVTFVDAGQFTCLNDHTTSFGTSATSLITPAPSGSVSSFPNATGQLICDCGVDGLVYCYLDDSMEDAVVYNGITTTVNVSGGIITSNLRKVSYFNGIYYDRNTNWDSDTYISQREDEWAFTYDHLYKELGTDGTYGVVARLAAASASSSLIAANKAKNDLFAPIYQRFTAWTKVLDNTDPLLPDVEYDGMVSFTCDGDLTTTIPLSANILMDCGTDGMKGGIVSTSTYYPPSAGSYTEVILSPDLMNNETNAMFLTGGLKTVSISGAIILDNTNPALDDAVYENEVTFRVPDDYTSVFTDDTIDVECDCGLDGIFHFIVSSSTYVTGANDYTKIEYLEGLPITNNITCVSINTT